MTQSTHARIPVHLLRYIVDQNYERYTPEDQSVWRYIMRQLKNHLSVHAHDSYLNGLEKTGITVERIPSIDEIDVHLERFGWGAVPVSGFIPPAAFMEFQSIGVLPIASDMRTMAHLQYTPAPDIVHEAAGHAPILVHPEYAAYLRQYGEVARNAIISKEDMDQYEAIRVLSDIKEDPRSTPNEIARAEKRLEEISAAMKGVSEAGLLSRMNWWTAEYGLIGDLKEPRIFGAGLLSSVGEARACLNPIVKKIPLSMDCVDYSYDITEQQPQLFVARDFAHLGEVLGQLAQRLSYRRGGASGLERAREAATVNTACLNSGLQISGALREWVADENGEPAYLIFQGPSQLALKHREIAGQGVQRHLHGFSSPVGFLAGESRCLSNFSPSDLETAGIRKGRPSQLKYASGVTVEGTLKDWLYSDGKLVLLTFTGCRARLGSRVLFDPEWGEFDMAVGSKVVSVFGGPAQRSCYGQTEDFAAKRVPSRSFAPHEKKRHDFFRQLSDLRTRTPGAGSVSFFRKLTDQFMEGPVHEWLPGVELLEVSYRLGLDDNERRPLLDRLKPENFTSPAVQSCVRDGVALAGRQL